MTLGVIEQLLGFAPAARRHAQRDVTAPELIERMIGGQHRVDPALAEVLAPGARPLERVEVADDLPAVESRVADVERGRAVRVRLPPEHAPDPGQPRSEIHRHRLASPYRTPPVEDLSPSSTNSTLVTEGPGL